MNRKSRKGAKKGFKRRVKNTRRVIRYYLGG